MDENPVVFEKTLFLRGHIYSRSGLPKESNTYWECRYLRRGECTARATTTTTVNNETVILRQSQHTHPPNREEAQAEIHRLRLKRRAEDPDSGSPVLLVRSELAGVSSENLAKAIRRC